MKKTLATIVTAAALVASSYAQGTVSFSNLGTQLVKIQTSQADPTLINMTVGGGHVELLWAVTGTTDLNAFSSLAITDFHTAPGRFSYVGANGTTVTVPLTPAGGGAAFVIRGWTGASASYGGIGALDQFGYSSIFTLAATGNPLSVPIAGTPVPLSTFTGLNLGYAPVPEPTSMVLAGLGAASLLMFRRRS